MFIKKILFQFFYFTIFCLIQFVTCCFYWLFVKFIKNIVKDKKNIYNIYK